MPQISVNRYRLGGRRKYCIFNATYMHVYIRKSWLADEKPKENHTDYSDPLGTGLYTAVNSRAEARKAPGPTSRRRQTSDNIHVYKYVYTSVCSLFLSSSVRTRNLYSSLVSARERTLALIWASDFMSLSGNAGDTPFIPSGHQRERGDILCGSLLLRMYRS